MIWWCFFKFWLKEIMPKSFRYCSRIYDRNWFTLFYMIKFVARPGQEPDLCIMNTALKLRCSKCDVEWCVGQEPAWKRFFALSVSRDNEDVFSKSIRKRFLDQTWEDVCRECLDLEELCNCTYFGEKNPPTYWPIGDMEGRVWETSIFFKGGLNNFWDKIKKRSILLLFLSHLS